MAYVTVRDVEQRCKGLMAAINPESKKFSASTLPTLSDVEQYITDIESIVNGHLSAIGLSVPFAASSVPETRVRHYVLCGVVGLVYEAYASAGGDMDAPDGTKDLEEHIKQILKHPSHWVKYYSESASTASSTWTDHGTRREPFNPISKNSSVY